MHAHHGQLHKQKSGLQIMRCHQPKYIHPLLFAFGKLRTCRLSRLASLDHPPEPELVTWKHANGSRKRAEIGAVHLNERLHVVVPLCCALVRVLLQTCASK